MRCYIISEQQKIGRLAQLARAPAWRAGGQRFKSVSAHQKNQRWCFSLPLILFWFTPCGQARRYRAKRVRHRIGLSCNAKRPENIIESAFTLLDFRGNRACRNSVMAYVFFTVRDPAEDLSHMREDLLAAVKISENRCNPQRARRPMDL